MSTFVIYKKTFNESQEHIGYEDNFIMSYDSASRIDNSANFDYQSIEPFATHFEVIEPILKETSKPVLVGEAWELQEDATKLAAYTAKDKAGQIQVKYQEMWDDVITQMASVFGTTSMESAQAFLTTWERMMANPSIFSGATPAPKALFAVAGLSVGDDLDTDQKVTDYATAKFNEAETYGVWRLQRIDQFHAEKAAIELS